MSPARAAWIYKIPNAESPDEVRTAMPHPGEEAHNHTIFVSIRASTDPSSAKKVHSSHIRQFDCPGEHHNHQVSTQPSLNVLTVLCRAFNCTILFHRDCSGLVLSIVLRRQLHQPKRFAISEITNPPRDIRVPWLIPCLCVSIELAIMGISRDSRHKRSASGAKRSYYRSYHP
jgi:hypothetical protein